MSRKPLAAVIVFAVAAIFLSGLEAPANAGPEKKAGAKAGAALYQQNCLVCHGPKGGGDGPAAKALQPKPRKLNDPKIMSQISDHAITSIITKGGAALKRSPVMPPFPHLKKSQVQDLVVHIRQLCNCKENKKQALAPK